MRNRVWIALALASALGLAGCGGGGGNPSAPTLSTVASVNAASTAPTSPPSGGFKQMVVFGDSLSDAGTYIPAAVAAYSTDPNTALQTFGQTLMTNPITALASYGKLGGQFTVNPGPGWVADLANNLSLPVPLPNQIGYGNAQVSAGVFTPTAIFPAMNCVSTYSVSNPSLCTNFAQGGSRVSQQPGIGYYTINPATGQPYVNSSGIPYTSALTVPVSTQVQNYLAQFPVVPPATKPFNAQQLVAVLAGNNDIFMALSSVSTNMAKGMTQAAAVASAQAAVAQAADDLTTQVKTILSDGGEYVLVYTLPDTSVTPFGRALPFTYGLAYNQTAAAAGKYSSSGPPPGYVCNNTDTHAPCYLLSNLVQVFNQRLLNDLQGQAVKIVDGYGLFSQLITSPVFSNVTDSACDLTKVPNSLLCNANTLNSGVTVDKWLFADSVHPTPAGYMAIADATLKTMASFGWISQ